MINGKDYIFSALDEFVEVSGGTIPFALKKDGETILEGVARQFPDGRAIRFYLNRLSSSYLETATWNDIFIENEFWDYVGMLTNTDAGGQFQLINTDTDTEICSAFVVKGYGTQSGFTYCGIDGKADPRQKIFISHAGSGETIIIDDGIKNPQIVFDQPFTFDWESGTTVICYTANTDFTLSSVSGGWFSVTQAKADEFTGCLTFTYSENSGDSRDGTMCMDYVNFDGVPDTRCFPVSQKEYSDVGPGDPNKYLTFKVVSGGTITWVTNSTTSDDDDDREQWAISASTDGGVTWRELVPAKYSDNSGNTIVVNEGDEVMFKGTSSGYSVVWWGSYSYGVRFSGSSLVDVEGNIMSLVYGDNFVSNSELTSTHSFFGLFGPPYPQHSANYLVRSAEKLVLPTQNLTEYCYANMFSGAENLTTPPYLPSKNLAEGCYSSMFNGCISLTKAPRLPADVLAKNCYRYMFYGCTSLTTAPSVLPATELTEQCYLRMFYGCNSLTTAPELPDVSRYVWPLTVPLTNGRPYEYMFSNCTSLNYVKCLLRSPNSNYMGEWLYNVSPTGTFVKAGGASWVRSENGIPSGWTVQEVE